jgi:H+/gluconate symporter-like permease
MSRRNEPSIAENVVKAASYMPWWACLLLALISFLIFNSISNMPEQPLVAGQAGNHLGREAMKIFAFFAKIVIPSLLVLAGIISGIKKKQGYEPDEKEKQMAYVMLGVFAVFLIAFFILFSMVGRNAGKMFDNINSNAEMNLKKAQERQQDEK